MSKRRSLGSLSAQAKEEEKKYDWAAAAIVHKEALLLARAIEAYLQENSFPRVPAFMDLAYF